MMVGKKLIFILFVSCEILVGQEVDTARTLDGFRNARFGMSRNEVKNFEKAKRNYIRNEDDTELYYFGAYAGLKCYFYYVFNNDSLVQGQYDFYEIFVDKNKYIEMFNRVTAELIMEYGEPTLIQQWWRNQAARDQKEMWGYAIGRHQMQLIAVWEFENGAIESRLYGFNGHLSIEVNFYDHKISLDEDKYW